MASAPKARAGEIVITGDGEGARLAAEALQAFAARIAAGAEATAAELEAAIRLTLSSRSGWRFGRCRSPDCASR